MNLGSMSVCPLEYRLGASDKLVFLHIPKTAGTTLATILQNQFAVSKTCPAYFSCELLALPRAELARYHYFRGHFFYTVIQQLIPSPYATITMLRDPVEQYVSAFAHYQRSNEPLASPGETIEREKIRAMSLEEFVDNIELPQNRALINNQSQLIEGRFELEIAVRDRNIDLNIVKQRLDHLTVVGLTERFQESLFLLAYAFGWLPVIRYHRQNVGTNRPPRERIPATTLNRIAELNSPDYALYHHAQQLFEARFVRMTHELLEQYGTREHAHVTLPLPHETMVDLLEKHYERRYAEVHSPIRSLHLNVDQPISGLGWHLPQDHPQYGACRWSGPETVSTLDLPLADGSDLIVTFRVLMALAPDVLESLTLAVNDHPIPLDVYRDTAGTALFMGRIPRQVLMNSKPFARLRFHVSRTLAPCELDVENSDTRELGLLYNWLSIYPADSLQVASLNSHDSRKDSVDHVDHKEEERMTTP